MGGTRPQALPGPATIWQMFKPLLIKYQGPMKLTKKEKDFLINFLDDGLHRELEIRREQDMDMADFKARKLLPKIIKKLINENKRS